MKKLYRFVPAKLGLGPAAGGAFDGPKKVRVVAQLVVYQYGVLGVACSSHVSPTGIKEAAASF
jgi:hypothetical protein